MSLGKKKKRTLQSGVVLPKATNPSVVLSAAMLVTRQNAHSAAGGALKEEP